MLLYHKVGPPPVGSRHPEIRVTPERRPRHQFEGLLKAVRHTAPATALRASVPLAKMLCALGRPFGPAGSRHIVVIASRGAAAPR